MQRKKPKEPDALSRIVKLCNYCERCTFDLKKRLIEEQYDPEDVHLALQKAKELNVLDDSRYARVYINSKIAAGKGINRIVSELERKEIDLQQVEGWTEEFHADDEQYELNRALDILKRKPTRAKNVYASCYRRLVSRGFSLEIARHATNIYLKIIGGRGF